MTDAIEFEVTEQPKTKKMRVRVSEINTCQVRDMTPAELDIVARKMGYVKNDPDTWWSEIRVILESRKEPDENLGDTMKRLARETANPDVWIELEGGKHCVSPSCAEKVRRIIAERDDYHTRLGKALVSNIHRIDERECTLDGVTYRGNEETIGKMRELSKENADMVKQLAGCDEDYRDAMQDLKRQLAEAKEQSSPPMPDKWRKALSDKRVHGACPDVGYAAKLLVDAFRDKYQEPKYTVLCAIAHLLNWLAAELEKGGG